MSLTARVVWVIERNLGADLSLAAVAEACGVSRCHLAHAFGEAAGLGVVEYVRARRLTEAAGALAAGAGNILELGLEAGYASHEAFSRAFRARLGATPEQVRRAASTAGLPLTAPMAIAAAGAVDLPAPRIEALGPLAVVGLSQRTSFAATEAIPAQWRRFMPLFADIPNRAPIPVGVTADVDAEGGFTYLCGAEVPAFAGAPVGLLRRRIEPQTYAVFRHPGHISTIRQTYAAIWNEALAADDLAAADGPSLERHGEAFDTATGHGGVELWIPIVA